MLERAAFEKRNLVKKNCPVIWLTGLSGSGKSTLAKALSAYFEAKGIAAFLLDGDELRNGINIDLGFTDADRNENLRRAAEIAKLFQSKGFITICSFISPTAEGRAKVAKIIGTNFYEIFVNCSLQVCEKRDVKGLYEKARKGSIPNFTGISATYEIPEKPDLILDTEQNNLDFCLKQLIQFITA